jgi:DNA-nicking Smr family endonuclease
MPADDPDDRAGDCVGDCTRDCTGDDIDEHDQADDRDREPLTLPIEPTLDLHAFAPRDVVSVVEEYLTAAHAAGLREVRLIHGRGIGVQRGRVQAALERHPLVVSFDDAADAHLGATIARLRD